MKKALALLLALIMLLAFAACQPAPPVAPETPADPGVETPAEPTEPAAPAVEMKVGVSMPTQSLQRWNQDGANMKEQLEAAGYTVDLQFAGDNDIPTQVSQLETMISGGCNVLVIAAIDGKALTTVLESAKAADIKVIAYDRLIMDTDALTYYASFDNTKVGVAQGQFIADQLKLETEAGPFNIELFTGDPDDNNVTFFWGGALSVLQPYIDSGKLVVQSGQVEKDQCATAGWSTEKAQARMENLISSKSYGPTKTKLDAVMSSNDSVGTGIINALVNAGYTKDNMPIVTGQDCDITATKNMIAGLQAMSVFKDTRTLAGQVVKMITAIANGTEPEINNTTDYDNGVIKNVNSFLCEPVSCTVENYKELLIDSGYYKEAELEAAE